MAHIELRPNVFDCTKCHTPCNSETARRKEFDIYRSWGERVEEVLMYYINSKGEYYARKTANHKYPDITLYNKQRKIVRYLEVKTVLNTFMKIQELLPEANITPSEVVVLNDSHIKKYKEIQDETKIPVFVIFVVGNRPCITNGDQYKIYYQDLNVLYDLYEKEKDQRTFKRKVVENDTDDQGNIKSPLLKVHFSLNELKLYKI